MKDKAMFGVELKTTYIYNNYKSEGGQHDTE